VIPQADKEIFGLLDKYSFRIYEMFTKYMMLEFSDSWIS